MMTNIKRVVCVYLFLFSFATMAFSDEVILKSGKKIEGEVTEKGQMWIEVKLPDGKRKVNYLLENVASINGVDPNAVLKTKEPASSEKKTKLNPKTVILHFKNGKTLKGILIEKSTYYLRIRPEGEKLVKEVLWESLSSVDGIERKFLRKSEEDTQEEPVFVKTNVDRINNARMGELAYNRNVLSLKPGERKALREMIDLSKAQDQKIYDERVEKETGKPKIGNLFGRDNSRTDFEMGMEVSHITYDEPGVMQEKGNMQSIYGKLTYRLSEDAKHEEHGDSWGESEKFAFLQLDTRYGWGQVDYDSSGTGEMSGVSDYMLEIRALLGQEWLIRKSLTLIPFAGIGYRYLNDDLDGTSTTGDWGYERESTYYYLPVGCTAQLQVKNNWFFGFTAEYDYFFKGRQKSHLEDGGYSIQDSSTDIWYIRDTLINDQDGGYGLRGALRVMRKDKRIDLFLETFVRYWSIERSETSQITSEDGSILWYEDDGLTIPLLGVEPKNHSTEYGIKFGFLF